MAKSPLSRIPFGNPTDLHLSIQPYLETDRFDGVDYAYLRFDITINKEHANQYEPIAWFLIAEGDYRGERVGAEWESLQLHWQSQYEYLQRHLQSVIAWSTMTLCGEAAITQRQDWDIEAVLADSDLDEIEEWMDRHVSGAHISGAWQHGDRFRFLPHNLIFFHAQQMWDRLRGVAENKIDVKTPIGSFTEEQHQKVLREYEEYCRKWKAARNIVKSFHHQPNEQARLLNEASGSNLFWRFPDDLIQSLNETIQSKKPPRTYRPKYRPGQIALVHLARDAWLLNKDGSILRAHQWHSIRRAINKYSSERNKPQLKIEK